MYKYSHPLISNSYNTPSFIQVQDGVVEVVASELPVLLRQLDIKLDDSKLIKASKALTRPSGNIY
jgi:hypothetical protein